MPRGGHRRRRAGGGVHAAWRRVARREYAARASASVAASVVDALARSGWHVRPGSAYAVGSTGGREALRVTTATTSERDAERFAAALAGVLGNTEERLTCAR